jgi:hypothetical protein
MCNFTVYVEENDERKEVAKDIIKAKRKDGTVLLMGAMGELIKVESASIEVVDTLMQELILKKI